MNEQLQKIAEEAGVDARTMGFEANQHLRDPWNARLDLFKQLIVRECGNFLKDTLDDHFAAEQLEEHFGVE